MNWLVGSLGLAFGGALLKDRGCFGGRDVVNTKRGCKGFFGWKAFVSSLTCCELERRGRGAWVLVKGRVKETMTMTRGGLLRNEIFRFCSWDFRRLSRKEMRWRSLRALRAQFVWHGLWSRNYRSLAGIWFLGTPIISWSIHTKRICFFHPNYIDIQFLYFGSLFVFCWIDIKLGALLIVNCSWCIQVLWHFLTQPIGRKECSILGSRGPISNPAQSLLLLFQRAHGNHARHLGGNWVIFQWWV